MRIKRQIERKLNNDNNKETMRLELEVRRHRGITYQNEIKKQIAGRVSRVKKRINDMAHQLYEKCVTTLASREIMKTTHTQLSNKGNYRNDDEVVELETATIAQRL